MSAEKTVSETSPDAEREASPTISVIVVNYNGGDFLQRCIASLARQTYPSFETILVDNASTDGSLDAITDRPANFRVLRETTNRGFAGGNNHGVSVARGEWIALLNPDAEADPDWLENLLRAARLRPSHRIVASLQVALDDSTRLDGAGDCYLAFGYAWRGGFGRSASETPGAGECFAPCGAAAFFPRSLFVRAGGFDESYFCYHEDVDIGFRFRLMGERCQFEPSCRIRHAGSGIAGRASDFAVFHGARNGFWSYVKNMPAALLALTFPFWILGTAAILARGLATGRFGATARGLSAAIAGIGPILSERRRVQRLRKASLASIVAALSWNPFRFLLRKPDVRPFRMS